MIAAQPIDVCALAHTRPDSDCPHRQAHQSPSAAPPKTWPCQGDALPPADAAMAPESMGGWNVRQHTDVTTSPHHARSAFSPRLAMLSVVPDELLTELDARLAAAHGSLTKVDVRKRRIQATRASMWIAGVSVALLVAAGFVATLHSIANSDAKAPAGDAPADNGSAQKRFEDAHAEDSPAQAVVVPTMSSRRSRSSCLECGVVESIRHIERSGAASAMGTGNARVDSGNAGGDSGGVVATNATTAPSYEISVRFRDGSSTAINQASPQPWRLGSQVIVVGRSMAPSN